MSEIIEYSDKGLIKNDLKRLKGVGSMGEDIKSICEIIIGGAADDLVVCTSLSRTNYGDFITQKTLNDKSVFFYKKRFATTNPKKSPSEGGRLVYGICRSLNGNKLIPIFAYVAKEEKSYYEINNKKIPLKKAGLIKIIEEKLLIY